MRFKLFVIMMAVVMGAPNVSFGFGLLQYVFDGVKNQLGLDRGPVPKVLPQENPHDPYGRSNQPAGKFNPDRNRVVIQAEGF